MKRYTFTVLLAIVGIVGISFFYFHVNRTVSAHEKLLIETVSGDESEIEDMTLTGIMFSHNIDYSFELTKGQMKIGSNYLRFFDNYYAYSAAEMRLKELRQKYKSFMRGKNNAYSLYEDQNFLVYGDLLLEKETNGEILISMYDKEKEDKLEFSVPIPADLVRANYINIMDVQLYNQEVVLLLSTEEKDKQEIWRISINANQKKISDQSLVYRLDRGLDDEGDYKNHLYGENSHLTKVKYMPLHVTETINNGREFITESHQLFILNVESGELMEIKLAEDVLNNSTVYVDSDHVYYLDKNGELFRYNEGSDSFESVLKHNGLIRNHYNLLLEFAQNKLYVLKNEWHSAEETTDKVAELFIIDLQTKQEVFHGIMDYSELQASQFDFTAIYPKTFN